MKKNNSSLCFLYFCSINICSERNIRPCYLHSPAGQGERIGISYDGTWITYNTNASNLGVPKGNIVKQNTETGEIIPVTKITNGSTARPMISREGNFVIAGCSEKYDKRFSSSGIFVIYTGK